MIVKAICTTGLRIDPMMMRTSLTDSTTGSFFYTSRSKQVKNVPGTFEVCLIEELDATQVDSDGTSGYLRSLIRCRKKRRTSSLPSWSGDRL